MQYKRNTRKKSNQSSKYLLPLILIILAFWVIYSGVRGKSTFELIQDGYHWVLGEEAQYPNRDELTKEIVLKDVKIDSLRQAIQRMENASPYRTATVNTTATSLNLRAEPNLSSEVVIKIPDSSYVKILYYDEEVLFLDGEEGKWCKIKYADKEGWVWGNYLQLVD